MAYTLSTLGYCICVCYNSIRLTTKVTLHQHTTIVFNPLHLILGINNHDTRIIAYFELSSSFIIAVGMKIYSRARDTMYPFDDVFSSCLHLTYFLQCNGLAKIKGYTNCYCVLRLFKTAVSGRACVYKTHTKVIIILVFFFF